jgi:hypothetical protein
VTLSERLDVERTVHRLSTPVADRNDEVFEHVRRELSRRPELPLGVLHQLALTIDPSISQDSRVFHALYVTPLKHEAARAQRRKRQSRAGKGSAPAARKEAPHATTIPDSTPVPQPVKAPRAAKPRTKAPAPRPADTPQRPTPKAEAPSSVPAASPGADRDRIRSILFSFAQDLAAADTRVELVRVLVRIDRYVDQAIQREHNG